MNRLARLPLAILCALALFNIARGAFHFLAPDSGAGSVAGMELSHPNRADVIFLLGAIGLMQLSLGVIYIYFVLWARQLIALALWVEAARGALIVLMEFTFKMPVAPVPGRFAHIATLVIAAAALLVYYSRHPSPSSSG